MEQMIPVSKAKELIHDLVQSLDPLALPLQETAGLTLAEDILSPYDIPAYPQSSMDGYSFAFEEGRSTYELEGEMAAGSRQQFNLVTGKAIRIFTGAAVPNGADTVLVQEKARVENGLLHLADTSLQKGDNVRPIGSEIQKGEHALSKGDRLQPASIGFLAGMGIDTVKVFPRPKVSIFITGNELQALGQPLGYGQVYDSNSYTLRACLEQLQINHIALFQSGDDPAQLQALLAKALQDSDLVLMTGGVSVGDYDFTMQAFEACGVMPVFHKIRQKPGKPILFGMKENKAVFGLPGNPASVLTCFYEYVLPSIGKMMNQNLSLKTQTVPIADEYNKPAILTHFLKGVYDGQVVKLERGQESYKLSSFATANCLVVLPEETTRINKGDLVEIQLIS